MAGHYDTEKVKSVYVHVAAIMDPGCVVFCFELSLAAGWQLNNSCDS